MQYPVKLIYLSHLPESGIKTRAMFIVPKKKFKRSPDRNKLKRRMREAYRLQKASVLEKLKSKGLTYNLAFLYIGNSEEPYSVIAPSLTRLLNFLTEEGGEIKH
jgi:ribonuclease P protein component